MFIFTEQWNDRVNCLVYHASITIQLRERYQCWCCLASLGVVTHWVLHKLPPTTLETLELASASRWSEHILSNQLGSLTDRRMPFCFVYLVCGGMLNV